MPSMTEAIEALYEAFKRYPRPNKIECCPCGCTPPDATAHLVVKPLRDLPFADLADYSFSAMTTQGSVDDFRHFLPRLLEGIAKEPYTYCAETLFHKISYGKWITWPQEEQSAIMQYLDALWRYSLESFPIERHLPACDEIESVLSSIAQTGLSLSPYLEDWAETQTIAADEHLIQLVTMHGSEFASGQMVIQGYWADAKVQAQKLRSWLLLPETLQRVKRESHLLRNDGFEHLFIPSLHALEEASGNSLNYDFITQNLHSPQA
ncbi:MAG TPA: hypothetical protein VIM62_12465 [Acidobacteriaceae bacterium]